MLRTITWSEEIVGKTCISKPRPLGLEGAGSRLIPCEARGSKPHPLPKIM